MYQEDVPCSVCRSSRATFIVILVALSATSVGPLNIKAIWLQWVFSERVCLCK